MKRIKLAYGREGLDIWLPTESATVVEPTYVRALLNEAGAIRRALQEPLGTRPLAELVTPSDRVVIVVCDATRPMPTARVLPPVLEALTNVPSEQITILIATGTHRPATPEELTEMLGEEIARCYRVVNHDARDEASLDNVGETPRGGPVWLNRTYLEATVRVTLGFIEPHFFAGFSGGPKMVAPGVAGLETVMHLHSAPLIAHPQATWGVTVGNPIHHEIRAIADMAPPTFTLDVALNRDHGIIAVWTGDVHLSHAEGCAFVQRVAMQPLESPFDIVITTNSGYPLDQNLYQSVKGMSAAAKVVRPGGTIICVAECADGLPEHGSYGQLLRSESSPEILLERIQSPGFCMPDQWQVQIQAQIQQKARVLVKCSGLHPHQVRAAQLEPVDDVEATIETLLAEYGPEAHICVLPQGPQTIPYLAGEIMV